MILNVIYDARREEKWEPLMNELATNEVDYKIWDAIVLPSEPVYKSINLSHKQIVRYAKSIGLDEVAIGEDDLMFTSPDSWKYFLDNKPEKYELYLASTYIMPVSANQICGFHCYMVHSRFFDTFLATDDNDHIDTLFNNIKGDYKICYPFAALQSSGWSANNKAVVNYNNLLSDTDKYDPSIHNFSGTR